MECAEYSTRLAQRVACADSGDAFSTGSASHERSPRVRSSTRLISFLDRTLRPLRYGRHHSVWRSPQPHLLLGSIPRAIAQTTPQSTPNPAATTNAQDDTDTPPPTREPGTASVAENIATAWSLLTAAVTDAKHPQHRIQALAAIGTLGASPRAEKMLTTALHDPDLDVRTAAILAAGQSGDRNLIAPLRQMLDDKEPQVAFTAATTLWKQNDHSGEDILRAVVDGERKTNAGLVNGTLHTVNEDLHSPSTLARIGALQGASLLLGPFGFGITAYEYIHKNGGDSHPRPRRRSDRPGEDHPHPRRAGRRTRRQETQPSAPPPPKRSAPIANARSAKPSPTSSTIPNSPCA